MQRSYRGAISRLKSTAIVAQSDEILRLVVLQSSLGPKLLQFVFFSGSHWLFYADMNHRSGQADEDSPSSAPRTTIEYSNQPFLEAKHVEYRRTKKMI